MANTETAEETGPAAEQPRTVLYLGNHQAVEHVGDERIPVDGKRYTHVVLAAGSTLMSAFHDITGPAGIWAHLSDADAPKWVAAEGPLAEGLITLLSAQYPGVEIRDVEVPDDQAEAA
jgi:hypothetical protein